MNKKEFLSLGIFLVILFLIGMIFFVGINTDIQIQIQEGKVINSKIPASFNLSTTIFLMFLSIIGTWSFIYFISDLSKNVSSNLKQKTILKVLSGDEKKMYHFILEKGECLQKDLIYELGFGKAKVTRVLDKLDQKGAVKRISYGKTNKIIAIK